MTLEIKFKVKKSYYVVFNVSADICNGPLSTSFWLSIYFRNVSLKQPNSLSLYIYISNIDL